MRALVYGIAVVAALVTMVYIAQTPADLPGEPTTSAVTDGQQITPASMTLNVPKMHCPFACYPSVKKTLEGRDDVLSVELVPQKEEGIIDNPQVVVTYKQGFQADNAIDQLDQVGFSGTTVVQ